MLWLFASGWGYSGQTSEIYGATMTGIKVFFGYMFLLMAALLAVTQSLLFPFSVADGLGVGGKTLLFILTIGCVIGGVLGLESSGETMGKKIATVGALILSIMLVFMMAFLVLTNSPGTSGWEYLIMLFYIMAFGAYGFIGTGAL